ncbi:hypothetical protein LJR118_003144 [Acidovorax sp. LjRoot118]|uniref:hypothetical protein n=1 Tax=Acidovorax sp. LjRoot118 TaxID=3342256 RepID=UPI003ED023AA
MATIAYGGHCASPAVGPIVRSGVHPSSAWRPAKNGGWTRVSRCGPGQLGNGTSVNTDKPVNIGAGFTQVAVGSRYMVALKADGSLWMRGHALLKNKVFYETSPVQIGSGFSQLLTSDTAAKAGGTAWFWGDSNARLAPQNTGVSE